MESKFRELMLWYLLHTIKLIPSVHTTLQSTGRIQILKLSQDCDSHHRLFIIVDFPQIYQTSSIDTGSSTQRWEVTFFALEFFRVRIYTPNANYRKSYLTEKLNTV